MRSGLKNQTAELCRILKNNSCTYFNLCIILIWYKRFRLQTTHSLLSSVISNTYHFVFWALLSFVCILGFIIICLYFGLYCVAVYLVEKFVVWLHNDVFWWWCLGYKTHFWNDDNNQVERWWRKSETYKEAHSFILFTIATAMHLTWMHSEKCYELKKFLFWILFYVESKFQNAYLVFFKFFATFFS